MTNENSQTIATEVMKGLRQRSKEVGEDMQYLLQRYAGERFLYRLGESTFRSGFVLKGGMLFPLLDPAIYRPTRDIDFTGYGPSDEKTLIETFRTICELEVEPDGMIYDARTLVVRETREDNEYAGMRVTFNATLGEARIKMQIDVGFGNAIFPPAKEEQYPTLLGGLPPQIRAYPRESVIAEKFQAMVHLGMINSRLKDFYDLYTLSTQFSFEGATLSRSVQATFERRSTGIDEMTPLVLTSGFYADENRGGMWRAYLEKNSIPGVPTSFEEVGEIIRDFLGPLWRGLGETGVFEGIWTPAGPWSVEGEAR